MLANPVVIPALADPALWAIGLSCLVAEVLVLDWLLRRGGLLRPGLLGWLALGNLASWAGFLVAVDLLVPVAGGLAPRLARLGGLELAVVLVEASMLAAALGAPLRRRGAVVWGHCLRWSLLANGVSLGLSVAVVVATVLLGELAS